MAKKKKETRGRKKLPASERRESQLRIWLTTAEKAAIGKAGGERPATWARNVLLRAARRK